MSNWDRLYRQAVVYKEMYPPGTRIMLLHMGNDPMPVEDNTRGTVDRVDDIGTVHCKFDNGRCLGMVPGEDQFRKLTESELLEEQKGIASLKDVIADAASRQETDAKTLPSESLDITR